MNDYTILIVDDTPNNLDILSETLSDCGFQVSVAIDGESALEQIEYCHPELILLDVMMPGIDGFETCRRLKANPKTQDIPIIFMTALSDTKDKVKGLSLGAVDYITKPFQQEEVLARVQTQLRLKHLTKTLTTQNQILKSEIEKRKQAEADLQTLNQQLEQRVMKRTNELSNALENLKKAEMQLVCSEKMSSLGQLVAGIAHEINNPINFIYGNITPATQYVEDVLKLIELFDQDSFISPAIQNYKESIDFEFLKEDLPKLLSSMKIGADRIRQIVLSLRNFSRLDEAEKKPVDIHEGIDSTLLILQNRLKAKSRNFSIEVIKDYGEIPKVECYPSQLNQVFVNLIANAIDALEEQSFQKISKGGKSIPGQIWIRTQLLKQNWVRISIADNGPGIPEHCQHKIFDSFFTTKPVGKGTGLGLSISHQLIVEKHGGDLKCISTVGQGTEFVIELPVQAAPNQPSAVALSLNQVTRGSILSS